MADMMKTAGEVGTKWTTDVCVGVSVMTVCVMDFHHLDFVHTKCNAAVKNGYIPED